MNNTEFPALAADRFETPPGAYDVFQIADVHRCVVIDRRIAKLNAEKSRLLDGMNQAFIAEAAQTAPTA